MKKVLITGASGFIGKNLVNELQAHYQIVPVSRKEADLLDAIQVQKLFQKENIDVVIHAATQSTLGRGTECEQQLLKNNLQMFLNLEQCHESYGKLIFLGSGAEYDKRRSLSMVKENEFGSSIPTDNYGLSKYLISRLLEKDMFAYHLRLFGIFGAYENYNYRFISNVICKALDGADITIHQNVKFDYLYIKDFCRMLPWFIEHTPSEHVYNVCTGVPQDIVSIAREILRQTGSKSSLRIENDGWNREYTGDNQRMLAELGDVRFTPMKQAIAELISFYQNTEYRLEGDY